MTPKEKAKELVDKYYWAFGDGYLGNHHIQCALIAVDELIYSYPHTYDVDKSLARKGETITSITNVRPNLSYWIEVKQEIENL